jgi:FixJ family two-component response regulator
MAPDKGGTICLVEDDRSLREALSRLLTEVGYQVVPCSSCEEFLNRNLTDVCACLLLDIRLPGQSGLGLQARLIRDGIDLPIVFMTGHGDVPMAVKALKAGALEFLTKPIDEDQLLEAVRKALDEHKRRQRESNLQNRARQKMEGLTPREKDVFRCVITGAMNKQTAYHLGIAEKTVKIHRGQIMKKLGAASVVDLVHLAEQAGIDPAKL